MSQLAAISEDVTSYLQACVKNIMASGPSRVLIDATGTAVSSLRARRDHGVEPDVIFIRNDGWSLGAPWHLFGAAEAMWPDQWIGILRRPETEAEPYHR